MQKVVENVINSLVSEFRSRFGDFHGIYLYGLFLDGKEHKNEDIELVAIFDVENKTKRQEIWPIVGKLETELDVCIDLNPTTMEELQKDAEFYDEVINHGKFFQS